MTDTDEQMGTMLRETAARVFQDHTESRDLARAEAGLLDDDDDDDSTVLHPQASAAPSPRGWSTP